jgi:uncharacterized membrane protein YhhN
MNRVLAILAAIASALYLVFSGVAPYPSNAVLKTSVCVLLAALALRSRNWLLASALLFSAIGDALLAIDGTKLFVLALASFLITHLLYAVIFVRVSKEARLALNVRRKIGMVLPIVFAVVYAAVLWPHLGALAIPVLLYIAAIVAMTVLSFRVKEMLVPAGALLFMASDSLIAYAKFIEPMGWQGIFIWVTYAAAQQLITHGLLRET